MWGLYRDNGKGGFGALRLRDLGLRDFEVWDLGMKGSGFRDLGSGGLRRKGFREKCLRRFRIWGVLDFGFRDV